MEDAALIFRALNGPDPRDPQTLAWTPVDPLPMLRRGIAGLRLAVMPEAERTDVDKEVLAICDEEASRFHSNFWGSRAIAGLIEPGEADALRDSDGVTLAELDSFFAFDPLFDGGVFVGGR